MKQFILLVFLTMSITLSSQPLTQQVYGKVLDKNSHQPLVGATISVAGNSGRLVSISDSNGNFVFNNVPVGRNTVSCSYVGYQNFQSDPIIVSSAKQGAVTIEMEADRSMTQDVIVTSKTNPKQPVNKYALVSGRSFSAEETQRYAASANDPSRMALGFPGVQATRDTRSDIIIRGNNPVGMQWRLEGIDIPNPNHFARRGSSGGGITIFSLSMLGNSDFLTGAMPAEYGDVLSGAFDMHFRHGNNQKTEYTLKAGMIGLDFSTEGPIAKNKSSYLVNYRYSTLGLLNSIGLNLVGERESNTFQDLSFNIALGNQNSKSKWNIWGIGGYSKETQREVEDIANWKQYDDYATYEFVTKMGAIGVGNTVTLNENSFIKSGLVLTGQNIDFADDTLNRMKVSTQVNDESYYNGRVSFTTSYNKKFSALANMKAGVYVNSIQFNLKQRKYDYLYGTFRNLRDGSGSTWLIQPYWQMSLKPTSRLTINTGIHVMYLALNKQAAIDPRLSAQYRIAKNQTLTLAYGLHSKILPLGSYFYKLNSALPFPNKNLKMMRSHHYIAAYDNLLKKGWRFHAEAYYQRLFQIPVVNEVNTTYWLLNDLEGYASEPLVSRGKGSNVGVDISVEKFFNKGLFLITSFSVFNSTYQPLNGNTYNTRFNSNTTGSITGAKEWSMKKNKVFQLGWKLLYNGGLPLTPLHPSALGNNREPVLDDTRPFSEKVPAYFRTDTRLSLRKDKAKNAWQLALDIQNLFFNKNIDGLCRRYDPSVNQWIYRKQSGLVPVLSYQLDF